MNGTIALPNYPVDLDGIGKAALCRRFDLLRNIIISRKIFTASLPNVPGIIKGKIAVNIITIEGIFFF